MVQQDSQLTAQQPTENEQNQRIQSRFGVAAQDYVTSAVHAQGPDLPWLVEAAALTGNELVVDVGTGTGHTALALAPFVKRLEMQQRELELIGDKRRFEVGAKRVCLVWVVVRDADVADLALRHQLAEHFGCLAGMAQRIRPVKLI